MATLLEMPAILERMHLLSVDEYHLLPLEHVELLRGIVVTKMAKSPLHSFVCRKLNDRLEALVPKGFTVWKEEPLTFRDSEPEPDFSIVRGKPEDWLNAHPSTAALVVEVAISSIAVDREKADIYAQAGIPEYWLLRAADRATDIYRQPSAQGYLSKTTITEPGVLHCAGIPEIEIPLPEILPEK